MVCASQKIAERYESRVAELAPTWGKLAKEYMKIKHAVLKDQAKNAAKRFFEGIGEKWKSLKNKLFGKKDVDI